MTLIRAVTAATDGAEDDRYNDLFTTKLQKRIWHIKTGVIKFGQICPTHVKYTFRDIYGLSKYLSYLFQTLHIMACVINVDR